MVPRRVKINFFHWTSSWFNFKQSKLAIQTNLHDWNLRLLPQKDLCKNRPNSKTLATHLPKETKVRNFLKSLFRLSTHTSQRYISTPTWIRGWNFYDNFIGFISLTVSTENSHIHRARLMERRKRQRKKSVRNVFHVVFLHPSKNSSTLATSFLSVDFRFYSTLCSPLSIMTSSLHETRIDFLSFSKDDLVTRFVGECRFENKWLNE